MQTTLAAAALLFSLLAVAIGVPVATMDVQAARGPADTRAAGVFVGPFDAGFEVRAGVDTSRRINRDDPGVRLGLAVWYPASHGGPARRVTSLEYRQLGASQTRAPREIEAFEASEIDMLRAWRHVGIVDLSSDQARAALAATGIARVGAPWAGGRFPAAIVLGSPYYLSTTAEALATHGLIVVAPFRDAAQSNEVAPAAFAEYMEDSVRDAQWALDSLRPDTRADMDRVAAIGHGGGGFQALLLAMRSRAIQALVNIDAGNFSSRTGARQMAYYGPRRLRIPYLFIATAETRASQDLFEDFEAMRFSHRTEVVLDMPDLRHHDLSDVGRAVTAPLALRGPRQAAVQQAYVDVQALVTRFLSARLGTGELSADVERTLADGAAAGRFRLVDRPGVEPAPTLAQALHTLDERSAATLRDAYRRDPDAPVFAVDGLRQLLARALLGDVPEPAAALADFAVERHPDSAEILELGSRARERSGDRAAALSRARACAALDAGGNWRTAGAIARCREAADRLAAR